MPIKTTLERIEKADFFAVIPSGFYVFTVMYLCFSGSDSESALPGILAPLPQIKDFVLAIKDESSWLIFVVFVLYLMGSLIRSMPLTYAEKLIPQCRDRRPKWRNQEGFPYWSTLKSMLQEMGQSSNATRIITDKLPVLEDQIESAKTQMIVFNHWKDVICSNSPHAFAYYQVFESRSRFFVGMFWAGIAGVAGGIFLLVSKGWPAATLVGTCSIILIAAFGGQLKTMREQEAKVLLSLYIDYLQNNKYAIGGASNE